MNKKRCCLSHSGFHPNSPKHSFQYPPTPPLLRRLSTQISCNPGSLRTTNFALSKNCIFLRSSYFYICDHTSTLTSCSRLPPVAACFQNAWTKGAIFCNTHHCCGNLDFWNWTRPGVENQKNKVNMVIQQKVVQFDNLNMWKVWKFNYLSILQIRDWRIAVSGAKAKLSPDVPTANYPRVNCIGDCTGHNWSQILMLRIRMSMWACEHWALRIEHGGDDD